IELSIDIQEDIKIMIQDNGRGMSKDILKMATSPFYTTRKTRRVGLGLSFLKMLAEQTEGTFHIKSKENVGTTIEMTLNYIHPDMPPLGNLGEMIYTLTIHQDVTELLFNFKFQNHIYQYNCLEMKDMFGETLQTYSIMQGLIELINQEIHIDEVNHEITRRFKEITR
ncbi:MAG: ATP-binding protein, partial [Acholeplasmataceae bacterium]|nr:ATP-binding protein [Acholeplasmataceae bacterium]